MKVYRKDPDPFDQVRREGRGVLFWVFYLVAVAVIAYVTYPWR